MASGLNQTDLLISEACISFAIRPHKSAPIFKFTFSMYLNFLEKNNDFNLFFVIALSTDCFGHFAELLFYGCIRPLLIASFNLLLFILFKLMGITNKNYDQICIITLK